MKILCVIPARYASTRLPGKPLADIAGKPMIQHVYERACQAKLPSAVWVATDDQRVYDTVKGFGGQVLMTSCDHCTGTDRLAEVARQHDMDIIVNVQGDEPLIAPEVIDLAIEPFLQQPEVVMTTLKSRLVEEDFDNPAVVKVVTDKQGFALYFSRSLIPYPRNAGGDFAVYKHIGLYAYRRDFLLQYAAMEQTPLERAESLEQLRALENGYRIKVLETNYQCIGVDTPEDLERVTKIIKANQ
jgi:3-deoxy-manno-octulosonate cytidylyltransferase (CMP-KDO synthetase)